MIKKGERLILISITAVFIMLLIIAAVGQHNGNDRQSLSSLSHANASGWIYDGKININTADAQALMQIPGIGDALSARILAYREANGPFTTIDELTNVKGIGEGTLRKIQDFITTGES